MSATLRLGLSVQARAVSLRGSLSRAAVRMGANGAKQSGSRRFSTTRANGGDSWATVENCPFEAERQAKAQQGIQTATFALG
jgi:hypothetical protein